MQSDLHLGLQFEVQPSKGQLAMHDAWKSRRQLTSEAQKCMPHDAKDSMSAYSGFQTMPCARHAACACMTDRHRGTAATTLGASNGAQPVASSWSCCCQQLQSPAVEMHHCHALRMCSTIYSPMQHLTADDHPCHCPPEESNCLSHFYLLKETVKI